MENFNSKFKFFAPANICHDLTESQINNHETPEVEIIENKGIILNEESYDVRNIETGAIYKNISYDTLIKNPRN